MTGVLLALLAVVVFTDLRWHKIYNWATYPGALFALAVCGVGAALEPVEPAVNVEHPGYAKAAVEYEEALLHFDNLADVVGWRPLSDSFSGLAACGFCMLVCFVFFRDLSGGDVKLLTMQGAFLGLWQGVEVMLLTFVLGGAAGLIILIWRVGFWTLLVRCVRQAMWSLRLAGWAELSEEDRRQLQMPLYLAPGVLLAVVIVRFDLLSGLG